jgi:hypothetical protein
MRRTRKTSIPIDPETERELAALAMLARLQDARREGNHLDAVAAERDLEELGYVVRVIRPIPRDDQREEEMRDGAS